MSAAMMRLACSAVGRVARSSVIASPPSQNALLDCIRPRRAGSFSRWLAPTQDCPGARVVWMQAAMVDPVLDFEVAKVVTGDLVGLTLAHAVIRSSQSA